MRIFKMYRIPLGVYLVDGLVMSIDDFGNLIELSENAYTQLVHFRYDDYIQTPGGI